MGVLDRFSLDGKVALVTGCSRGLGRAMAVALAQAGADIIGVSSSLSPAGSEVEKQVSAMGRQFTGYGADFSNRDSLYSFIGKVREDFEAVDILVNNAGRSGRRIGFFGLRRIRLHTRHADHNRRGLDGPVSTYIQDSANLAMLAAQVRHGSETS